MSRITMSLENDFEGRVLASFDLDEFASKVRADAEEDAENRMNGILDDEKRLSYEQGRADQKEVDNTFFNFEGAWELEKKKVRADAINNFVVNAITEFQKFDKEHGYPTLGDISDILSDVAEQLKEQNNG